MAYVVGIDVGSQSAKGILVDDDGHTLAAASAHYPTSYPAAGWAEQDPADWQHAIAHVVRKLRANAKGEITMLALASQLDGLVPLDHHLRPVRPAIIWLDRRATEQSLSLSDTVGERALVARTGLNADASHVAPKAMWFRDEEPDRYRETRWLASVGGYLNAWLTGAVVHDPANASSTLLYDLAARGWSEELIAAAGLELARLPAIAASTDVIGPLAPAAAESLGLSRRCQLAVGTGDDHAAALGAGALGPGVVVDVTGTAEPVAAAAHAPIIDDQRLLETHAHAAPDMLLIENPGFVSGGSTQWWAATHGVSQREMFALAEQAPAGSDGVLFLPTLSGATAPRWNDRMRGAFARLGLHHRREHLARSVLEGCSFALRDIVDRLGELGLANGELRVVGGGARSPLWLQIKADVTGRDVRALRGPPATSAGAAMLAAVAAGFFADLPEAAAHTVKLAGEPVRPSGRTQEVYAEAYAAYRRLFDGVEVALR